MKIVSLMGLRWSRIRSSRRVIVGMQVVIRLLMTRARLELGRVNMRLVLRIKMLFVKKRNRMDLVSDGKVVGAKTRFLNQLNLY